MKNCLPQIILLNFPKYIYIPFLFTLSFKIYINKDFIKEFAIV